MKFREKLQVFMQGRYGTDDLGKFTLYLALILCILSLFTKNAILNTLALILLAISYFRMLSRKIYKRHDENQKFLALKYKVVHALHLERLGQMKHYCFFKCPTCKQTVRVPRGKGKIKIHCPKCHTDFIKKS